MVESWIDVNTFSDFFQYDSSTLDFSLRFYAIRLYNKYLFRIALARKMTATSEHAFRRNYQNVEYALTSFYKFQYTNTQQQIDSRLYANVKTMEHFKHIHALCLEIFELNKAMEYY